MAKLLLARLSLLAACTVGAAGCTVSSVERPDLTGPSTLAEDVRVTATPDVVVLDGVSPSTITVTVAGVNGEPLRDKEFRLSLSDGSSLGTITPATVRTGANGTATATFIPQKASPALAGHEPKRVSIVAVPVRSNYQTASIPSADMLLLYPPVPPATTGAPSVTINYSPVAPKVGNSVMFDAGASQAASGSSLVNYAWDFGDATPHDEHGSDASHAYNTPGTFNVTLAVTDSSGRVGYTFRTVVVSN